MSLYPAGMDRVVPPGKTQQLDALVQGTEEDSLEDRNNNQVFRSWSCRYVRGCSCG